MPSRHHTGTLAKSHLQYYFSPSSHTASCNLQNSLTFVGIYSCTDINCNINKHTRGGNNVYNILQLSYLVDIPQASTHPQAHTRSYTHAHATAVTRIIASHLERADRAARSNGQARCTEPSRRTDWPASLPPPNSGQQLRSYAYAPQQTGTTELHDKYICPA